MLRPHTLAFSPQLHELRRRSLTVAFTSFFLSVVFSSFLPPLTLSGQPARLCPPGAALCLPFVNAHWSGSLPECSPTRLVWFWSSLSWFLYEHSRFAQNPLDCPPFCISSPCAYCGQTTCCNVAPLASPHVRCFSVAKASRPLQGGLNLRTYALVSSFAIYPLSFLFPSLFECFAFLAPGSGFPQAASLAFLLLSCFFLCLRRGKKISRSTVLIW